MRKAHRIVAVFAVLIGLYIASTGITVQLMDLRALLRHAPATDPTMQGIRAGLDGPPNFQVIRDPDYSASPLPADFDFDSGLATVVNAGRARVGDAPLAFIELRMLDGKPVGQLASQGRLFRFDAATGVVEGTPSKIILQPISRPSSRNKMKDFHRMRAFGNWGIFVDVIAGLLMCTMIFTGLALYIQLLKSRVRIQRPAPIWFAGGWWRTLHRCIGAAAGAFLTVMAISGTILAVSSVGVVVNVARQHGRPAITADLSSPLANAELPGMLHTTLTAYRAHNPGAPVKVLRLRYFAGMPQGIIITGGDDTRQLAFNAATGRAASLSEPGYPAPGQTFGWQVDETAKRIHRGDFFGLTGRCMDLLAGIALLYLTISGAVLYVDLWNRRRKKGRRELLF